MTDQQTASRPARAGLMERHAAARARREAAALGSDDFRAAAEELARIEIAIAQLEEPPVEEPPPAVPPSSAKRARR